MCHGVGKPRDSAMEGGGEGSGRGEGGGGGGGGGGRFIQRRRLWHHVGAQRRPH
jgi:hypothetical protein